MISGKWELKIKSETFLALANQIVLYHHEKYNGEGYPEGLKGEEIPLSARIVAIVDVYDALTSNRVYKKAIDHDKAISIIQKEKGRHFDPLITEVFLKNHNKFK